MTHRDERYPDVGDAAVRGALAGLFGGAVMMMAMQIGQKVLIPPGERMDPPPKQLVEAVGERRGVALSETQAMAAGMGVHMGYSALWGAIFGVAQSRLHLSPALHGLLLGGVVYAGNFPEWGVLPRVGALPPPGQQPLEKAAIPVGAHAVFGLATAAAFEVLT